MLILINRDVLDIVLVLIHAEPFHCEIVVNSVKVLLFLVETMVHWCMFMMRKYMY